MATKLAQFQIGSPKLQAIAWVCAVLAVALFLLAYAVSHGFPAVGFDGALFLAAVRVWGGVLFAFVAIAV